MKSAISSQDRAIDWTQHEGLVRMFCYRLGYSPQHPEWDDVIQAGRIALWRAAETYDATRSHWTTYASRCILNGIRMYYRSQSSLQRTAERGVSLDALVDSDAPDGATFQALTEDPTPGPEDKVIAQERVAAFWRWAQGLSVSDQHLIRLRLQGATQTAMAQALGVSQAAVSRRLARLQTAYSRGRLPPRGGCRACGRALSRLNRTGLCRTDAHWVSKQRHRDRR